MSEPFLAEIRIVGFTFAPRGWALCDGQILPISQNQSLYSLLGTTYGGDGYTSFALPDLRGRMPMHPGAEVRLGQKGGVQDAQTTSTNNTLDTLSLDRNLGSTLQQENVATQTPVTPKIGLNFAIALQGLFPSRN